MQFNQHWISTEMSGIVTEWLSYTIQSHFSFLQSPYCWLNGRASSCDNQSPCLYRLYMINTWLSRVLSHHKPPIVGARCKTTATDSFCEKANSWKCHYDQVITDHFHLFDKGIPSNTTTLFDIDSCWCQKYNRKCEIATCILKISSCSGDIKLSPYNYRQIKNLALV